MVPIRGEWTQFRDADDKLEHYRLWGLIPAKAKKIRPIMVVDGYFDAPEPCEVVGYQRDACAVIKLSDGYHAVYGEYLAELQPNAMQKLPSGMCFAEILSRYVVFDIETTGLSRDSDRIIEIAAATYEYGVKVSEYQSFVDPCMLIPSEITDLTGITQEDVSGAPLITDIENAFLEYIGDLPLIGHNVAAFDVPFLSAQFTKPIKNPLVDTLPLAQKVFSLLPRHKLAYMNDILNLESKGAHRAINDVETTNRLLWACLAPRKYESLVNKAFLDERLCPSKPPKRKKLARERSKKGPTYEVIKNFKKVDIKAISPSCPCVDSSSPLCGKMIVFTGILSISREEAMQLAVNAGAILKNNVSSKTGYLVVGKQDIAIVGMDGMSSKEMMAHKLNDEGKAKIQILSEEEFLSLVKKEGASV